MSYKFKVGDRVRTTCGGGFRPEYKGQLGIVTTVREYNNRTIGCFVKIDSVRPADDLYFRSDELEPAGDLPLEELSSQELVDIANKGFSAINILHKRDDAEINKTRDNKCVYGDIGSWFINRKIRLKPKPSFKPYTIESTGWEVRLIHSVSDIAIGCKPFQVPDLQAALRALLDGEYSWVSGNLRFNATRKGIDYEGHTLFWADAEELYEKIKDL